MRGVMAGLLFASACYSPSPPAGAPCPDGVCPTGLVCSPATQTCEHDATAIDAPMIDAREIDAPVPYDATVKAFLYRRRITIVNTSPSTMAAGYTIRVPLGTLLGTLTAANKLKADYSDLRVIGDVAGERDRLLDTGALTGSWLNFSLATSLAPGGTMSDFAMYYGAPTAGPAPANGAAVFPIYDDFTTSIGTFWLKNDGPTVSGGKLILRANHTDGVTTTASADNIGITSSFELMATVSDPNSDPQPQPEGTFYYWWGFQHTGDFSASDPWAVFIARGKGQVHGEQKSPVGCEAGCDGTYVAQDTSPHYYAVERDPAASRFYEDGANTSTIVVTNTTDYSLMIRNFAMTSIVSVDWARARNRVLPDPTITLGSEEAL